jgi:regulator of nucleoside diphosphate kinase
LTQGLCMSAPPKLVVSSLDLERLEAMLETLPPTAPGRRELEAELARSQVVEPAAMPPNVVTMNSTVRFRVASSQESFCLTLVYPKDMDSSGEKISVLAPVGSALLGLSEGDEIDWPKPGGGMQRVHIDAVTYQPERAGVLYR